MVDLSKYAIKQITPYDAEGRGISDVVVRNTAPVFILTTNRLVDYYGVEFVKECGNQRTLLRVQASLDGRMSKLTDYHIMNVHGGVAYFSSPQEQWNIWLLLRELSLRFWLPEFNFRRCVYLYVEGEVKASIPREAFK